MITELTEAQKNAMPKYAEKWINIGIDTEDTDRETAIEAVNTIYNQWKDVANIDEPQQYVFVDSPLAAIKYVKDNLNAGESCSIGDIMSMFNYGSQEAGWLSSYDFFESELGLDLKTDQGDIIAPFLKLSKACGWWTVYNNVAVFSRKPIEINFVNGLLHNDNGPSVLYKDGFATYSINGHHVTEQIVMRPHTLTIDQINSEINSDIQSIMIERFGWVRFIEETNAVLVDSRKNEVENTLEALYNTNEFGMRLVVTCPTGRVFVKGIPANGINKCEEAQRWLGNDTDRQFNVIGRT